MRKQKQASVTERASTPLSRRSTQLFADDHTATNSGGVFRARTHLLPSIDTTKSLSVALKLGVQEAINVGGECSQGAHELQPLAFSRSEGRQVDVLLVHASGERQTSLARPSHSPSTVSPPSDVSKVSCVTHTHHRMRCTVQDVHVMTKENFTWQSALVNLNSLNRSAVHKQFLMPSPMQEAHHSSCRPQQNCSSRRIRLSAKSTACCLLWDENLLTIHRESTVSQWRKTQNHAQLLPWKKPHLNA